MKNIRPSKSHEKSISSELSNRASLFGLGFIILFSALFLMGCEVSGQSTVVSTITEPPQGEIDHRPTETLTIHIQPSETPIQTSPQTPTSGPISTSTAEPTATEPPTPTATIELPSDEQVIANLTAFTRLYGYVRYFHPNDEAVLLNWERVALNGVKTVKYAANPAELVQKLLAIFQPYSPTLRVFPVAERPAVPDELSLPLDVPELRVIMWQHYGVEGNYTGSIYHSDIISAPVIDGEIPEGFNDPREPYYAELGGGVAALIPLALFADEGGTLPHASHPDQNTSGQTGLPEELDRRLAGVVIAWNVFQHFYPYFEVVDTDWPQALEQALTGALGASNEIEFYDVLHRLTAQLHDGHARVENPRSSDVYSPNIRLAWVENSLVVSVARGTEATSVGAGDVVLAIDNQPVDQVLAEKLELTSGATPQWKYIRALHDLLAGPQFSQVKLEVQSVSGEKRTVTQDRTTTIWSIPLRGRRPPQVTELEPGIMYVDLDRVEYEEFEAALPQLEAASGIIFDSRGYPHDSQVCMETISHLIDTPVTFGQMYVPITIYPDQQNTTFDNLSWEIEPKAPRWRGEVVFLIDGTALSAAETFMSIIEHYRLAEIVGSRPGGPMGMLTILLFQADTDCIGRV